MSFLAWAAYPWLTWGMRIASRGNLTVELIRLHRFDHGYAHRHHAHPLTHHRLDHEQPTGAFQRTDRVELCQQPLSQDPWSQDTQRPYAPRSTPDPLQDASPTTPAPRDAKAITPILGAPSLAGLGVALVVPGTLLDVVA